MNKYSFILSFLLFFVFSACSKPSYRKIKDGIVVNIEQASPDAGKQIRLQVISGKIIRVTVIPDNKFDENQSLSVALPDSGEKNWMVIEKEDRIELKTDEIIAIVSVQTGEIMFTWMA